MTPTPALHSINPGSTAGLAGSPLRRGWEVLLAQTVAFAQACECVCGTT